ncbi:MAG: CapA family protein [Bacteroidales bacterium]|jgi:poly-gamma-glutamate synthesis protein (capsule biosynthesis protein)|nr:CapA family protein [Bacteroidales bacterium]
MKKIILFYLTVLTALPATSQQRISLLFAGDAMQHLPQINSAKTDSGYNYSSCFQYIKDEISAADIAVINLETTHAGAPYRGFPAFSAPDKFSAALQEAGFDIFLTCNNHSADQGKKGINRTIDVLDSLQIKHTGTFKNLQQRKLFYPLIIIKNGIRLAFLNYTYGTNGIAVEAPTIVNIINDKQIMEDIEEAKRYKPDMIIACMHWGVEYQRQPNNEQRRLAKLMTENGVGVIIGSHPHVIQPIEAKTDEKGQIGHIVAYSLGNFISNQNSRYTDSGAIIRIELEKDEEKTIISNCSYSLAWRYRYPENNKKHYTILPASFYENKQEVIQPTLRQAMKQSMDDARSLLDKHNINVSYCEYAKTDE